MGTGRVTIQDEFLRKMFEANPDILRAILEIERLPKARKKDYT